MRKIKMTRKKIVAGGAAALVLASAGVAFAFWTQSGSGSGSAGTGNTTPVTVNQTSTNTGLYPGGSAALTGTITNPNSSPVMVAAVTATVGTLNIQTIPAKPACTAADFTVTGTSSAPGSVAGNATGGAWTGLSLNMVNSGTNQDNCKGVTVPIVYVSN